MEQSTLQVAFLFRFYGCKSLYLLYLFVPQESVDLKESVSVTEQTRQPVARASHFCNLTVAAYEAYKHRLKSVVS